MLSGSAPGCDVGVQAMTLLCISATASANNITIAATNANDLAVFAQSIFCPPVAFVISHPLSRFIFVVIFNIPWNGYFES
jgi:hypothetical protein